MATKLFKSHVTALERVKTALHNSQKLNGGQIILGPYNDACRQNAEEKIREALSYLNSMLD